MNWGHLLCFNSGAKSTPRLPSPRVNFDSADLAIRTSRALLVAAIQGARLVILICPNKAANLDFCMAEGPQ
jgi:hypothetical protein